jgi:PQQ-dependent dehydrogenase (methanol/ethanol family)
VSRAVVIVVATAILAVALIFLFPGLWGATPPHATEPPLRAYQGSTGAVAARAAAPPDDGPWTMPAKNYASTRFAAATEINIGNVGKLQVAFTFSTGIAKGHEAAPLVVGGTMVIVTPFPNIVYALDLTKEGAPTKWSYKPKPLSAAQGVACCDVVNRGAAYADGRIFFNTLDNHTIALDAETGKEIWDTQLGSIEQGATMTMAPLVVDGKVLVGNSGGEMGVRGWLIALDAGSGKIAWKAYATGPDKDVLIGRDYKPFYASVRGHDLGVSSWPPEAWKIGGGNSWGWISYDPERRLVYYGTGNPGPWNAAQRPGDNLYTSGVFARDIDTGQARWFYQSTPHDLWDHDDINEEILLDMPVNGRTRQVMVRPDRNGYFYVLDRGTGEVLSATPYGYVTAYKGVDLKTGRLIPNPAMEPKEGRVVRGICPAAPGMKDWNPSAFSPLTGLVYIPHNNLCMDWGSFEANYIAGTPYVGADVKYYAGPGGNRGVVTAWDPVHARPVWEIKEDLPVWSGALTTGGGLMFYGTMDGWFKAVDQRSGKLLWKFKTGSGIIGQPISYRGPDGHQYIAILSGVGGWSGAVVSGNLDTRDATAAVGWGGVMADLPRKTTAGGMLYVFALPH